MVHLFIMRVLLDVEVVVMVDLIISVVDKAIWIIIVISLVVFRV